MYSLNDNKQTFSGVSWYRNGCLLRPSRLVRPSRQGADHHLHLFPGAQPLEGQYFVAAYTAHHCAWAKCSVLSKCKSLFRYFSFYLLFNFSYFSYFSVKFSNFEAYDKFLLFCPNNCLLSCVIVNRFVQKYESHDLIS